MKTKKATKQKKTTKIESTSQQPAPVATQQATPQLNGIAQLPQPKQTLTEKANEILNLGLDKYKKAVDDDLTGGKTEIKSLHSIMTEYLNDYIIIGHNVIGDRVFIRSARNPKEYDALREMVRTTLTRLMTENQL